MTMPTETACLSTSQVLASMAIILIIINSTDSFDTFSPPISIGHHSWQVLLTAPSVHTELIDVSFSVSMCKSL